MFAVNSPQVKNQPNHSRLDRQRSIHRKVSGRDEYEHGRQQQVQGENVYGDCHEQHLDAAAQRQVLGHGRTSDSYSGMKNKARPVHQLDSVHSSQVGAAAAGGVYSPFRTQEKRQSSMYSAFDSPMDEWWQGTTHAKDGHGRGMEPEKRKLTQPPPLQHLQESQEQQHSRHPHHQQTRGGSRSNDMSVQQRTTQPFSSSPSSLVPESRTARPMINNHPISINHTGRSSLDQHFQQQQARHGSESHLSRTPARQPSDQKHSTEPPHGSALFMPNGRSREPLTIRDILDNKQIRDQISEFRRSLNSLDQQNEEPSYRNPIQQQQQQQQQQRQQRQGSMAGGRQDRRRQSVVEEEEYLQAKTENSIRTEFSMDKSMLERKFREKLDAVITIKEYPGGSFTRRESPSKEYPREQHHQQQQSMQQRRSTDRQPSGGGYTTTTKPQQDQRREVYPSSYSPSEFSGAEEDQDEDEDEGDDDENEEQEQRTVELIPKVSAPHPTLPLPKTSSASHHHHPTAVQNHYYHRPPKPQPVSDPLDDPGYDSAEISFEREVARARAKRELGASGGGGSAGGGSGHGATGSNHAPRGLVAEEKQRSDQLHGSRIDWAAMASTTAAASAAASATVGTSRPEASLPKTLTNPRKIPSAHMTAPMAVGGSSHPSQVPSVNKLDRGRDLVIEDLASPVNKQFGGTDDGDAGGLNALVAPLEGVHRHHWQTDHDFPLLSRANGALAKLDVYTRPENQFMELAGSLGEGQAVASVLGTLKGMIRQLKSEKKSSMGTIKVLQKDLRKAQKELERTRKTNEKLLKTPVPTSTTHALTGSQQAKGVGRPSSASKGQQQQQHANANALMDSRTRREKDKVEKDLENLQRRIDALELQRVEMEKRDLIRTQQEADLLLLVDSDVDTEDTESDEEEEDEDEEDEDEDKVEAGRVATVTLNEAATGQEETDHDAEQRSRKKSLLARRSKRATSLKPKSKRDKSSASSPVITPIRAGKDRAASGSLARRNSSSNAQTKHVAHKSVQSAKTDSTQTENRRLVDRVEEVHIHHHMHYDGESDSDSDGKGTKRDDGEEGRKEGDSADDDHDDGGAGTWQRSSRTKREKESFRKRNVPKDAPLQEVYRLRVGAGHRIQLAPVLASSGLRRVGSHSNLNLGPRGVLHGGRYRDMDQDPRHHRHHPHSHPHPQRPTTASIHGPTRIVRGFGVGEDPHCDHGVESGNGAHDTMAPRRTAVLSGVAHGGINKLAIPGTRNHLTALKQKRLSIDIQRILSLLKAHDPRRCTVCRNGGQEGDLLGQDHALHHHHHHYPPIRIDGKPILMRQSDPSKAITAARATVAPGTPATGVHRVRIQDLEDSDSSSSSEAAESKNEGSDAAQSPPESFPQRRRRLPVRRLLVRGNEVKSDESSHTSDTEDHSHDDNKSNPTHSDLEPSSNDDHHGDDATSEELDSDSPPEVKLHHALQTLEQEVTHLRKSYTELSKDLETLADSLNDEHQNTPETVLRKRERQRRSIREQLQKVVDGLEAKADEIMNLQEMYRREHQDQKSDG